MENFKHIFLKKEYTEPLGTSSPSFSKIPKNHAPCSPAHFSDPSCLKAKPRPLKDFWGFVYLTAFGCAHLWRSEINCGVNSLSSHQDGTQVVRLGVAHDLTCCKAGTMG